VNTLGDLLLAPTTSVNITLAVVVSIITTLVLGTWRISAILNRMDRRFEKLERKGAETWNINDMRAWARLLDKSNAALHVPDVDGVIEDPIYRSTGTQSPMQHDQ
jgi:hypothetical protein